MKPLRVVAPCSCAYELDGASVEHAAWPDFALHTVESVLALGQWLTALRANPARAHQAVAAGYAMAAQGIGRKAE